MLFPQNGVTVSELKVDFLSSVNQYCKMTLSMRKSVHLRGFCYVDLATQNHYGGPSTKIKITVPSIFNILPFSFSGRELSIAKDGAELPQTEHERELQLRNTPETIHSIGPYRKSSDPSTGKQNNAHPPPSRC